MWPPLQWEAKEVHQEHNGKSVSFLACRTTVDGRFSVAASAGTDGSVVVYTSQGEAAEWQNAMCLCLFVSECVCVCVCVSLSVSVCMCVFVQVCAYMGVCVCVCVKRDCFHECMHEVLSGINFHVRAGRVCCGGNVFPAFLLVAQVVNSHYV